MKVVAVSYSDINGGASRAAYRIHRALLSQGVDSAMCVSEALAGDWTVRGPASKWDKAAVKARLAIGDAMAACIKTENRVSHSAAVAPTSRAHRLNESDADVVHLHWVNREMMSIRDIARIKKPVIWTLHDMWAFCGAEHYNEDGRWREGYTRDNRPESESGFDLNRWVWGRKRKHWRRPIQIVTPTRWLASCVRESALLHDWPVTVVHYAIDTEAWRPMDKRITRSLLGVPDDVPLLAFGAVAATSDKRKGFDLLRGALQHLRGAVPDLHLLVFGQMAPRIPDDVGFPVHYAGYLHDDLSLRMLYSAADVMAIPSRQDNLPNTGIEALSCGTPVVAFDVCGLPDIVKHEETGYLAKPFDCEDFAHGISWVLGDADRHDRLARNARDDAVRRFSYPVVAQEYLRMYETVIASS